MRKAFKYLRLLNWNTIFFNFKYLSFKDAIRLPIFLSRNVYLRTVSGRIIFECPVHLGIIKIGYGNVGIFDDKASRSIWDVSGTVIFQGRANMGHGSKISVGKNGQLIFGDDFRITAESSIVAFSKIQFGKGCLLSWEILIMDTDFHKIMNLEGSVTNNPEPIIFGDNVWVGCRSVILKGAIIPENCIIGAVSFVNKELDESNSLYGGTPLRCLQKNIRWEF